MTKKIIILLFLLTFPSVFYILLTTGKHNFVHLPVLGTKILAENGKDTVYHTVPSFRFVNQNGDTISENYFANKMYVVTCFSTDCKINCPKIVAQLLRVQEKFAGSEDLVRMLSLTLKPDEDTVPSLLAYANMVHANTAMWTFATGDKEMLDSCIANGYLIKDSLNNSITNFSELTKWMVLVDSEKHVRGKFDGTKVQGGNELIDAIKILLAEEAIKEGKRNSKKNKS